MFAAAGQDGGLANLEANLHPDGQPSIWASIQPTQDLYPGTQVPRSFILDTPNGAVWVAPNATEHLMQYATGAHLTQLGPEAAALATQAQLTSLHAAVDAVTRQGIVLEQPYHVGGWELVFGAPRPGQTLPALYHALMH